MRRPMRWSAPLLALATVAAIQWSLAAQGPAGAKRPLSYDVVDYWRSIQGTRLSADGQWLAYALTSQGDDGELIVRNLKTGQEYRHPRGTGPTFSQDARYCVFTIAQSKAEEEKERLRESRSSEGEGSGAQSGAREPRAGTQRNQPKTGLGIMTLADGKVTTVEKVGSFLLPEGALRSFGGSGRYEAVPEDWVLRNPDLEPATLLLMTITDNPLEQAPIG